MRPQLPAGLQRFMHRHGGELMVATLATVLAVLATAFLESRSAARQERFAAVLANQQEVSENLRYVRDRATPEARKPFIDLDLRSASLGGLDLSCGDPVTTCAHFQGSLLEEANLATAVLVGANFTSADLRRAGFGQADLSDAQVVGADARDADFHEAIANDVLFNDSRLARADFSGSGLSEAVFAMTDLTGARFEGAFATRSRFPGATLRRAVFAGASLIGADFSEADVRGALFEGACHDATTLWPSGFTPPPSRPDGCPLAGQL